MRLRLVQTVNFRSSELTNWLAVLAKHPEFEKPDSQYKLKKDDVVLLVSLSGDQLVFLYGFDDFEETKVLRSVRFRTKNRAAWNPLMLANYAKSVGIELIGLKTYEDHVKKIMKEG